MLAEKCRLGIAAQGQFFRRVAVRQGIGFLDAQQLHELQFHADVVQAIIEIRREVDPKGPIEPGDVGQALRFFENMRLPVLGFVGRAFLGNGVPEALEIRRLQMIGCPRVQHRTYRFGRGQATAVPEHVEAGLDPRQERAQPGAKRRIRIPEPEGQEPVNVAARDRYDFTLFGHGSPHPKSSWNEHRGG